MNQMLNRTMHELFVNPFEFPAVTKAKPIGKEEVVSEILVVATLPMNALRRRII
jgi:hypothetical protein